MVEPTEVGRGDLSWCICPACHAQLINCLDEEHDPHFSHPSDASPCSGDEIAIRCVAKEELATLSAIDLPGLVVGATKLTHRGLEQIRGAIEPLRLHASRPPEFPTSDDPAWRGLRPDVVFYGATSQGVELVLWIEIRTSSWADCDKAVAIERLEEPCVEIDLSEGAGLRTRDEIRALVLEQLRRATWIFHPEAEALRARLRANPKI